MHRSQKNKKKRDKHRRGNHGSNGKPSGKENIDGSEQKEKYSSDVNKCEKLPYEIKLSDIMGRYLVASRDLVPGDLIIRADPLVVGPWSGCEIICMGCYHPMDLDNLTRCSGCRWPLCSDKCQGLNSPLGHTKSECDIFSKHCQGDDLDDLINMKNMYLAVVPLRCLLLKSADPERWEEINTMVAHNDVRKQKNNLWSYNQLYVVDRIRKKWKMPEFSEDEIHTICGILEVNAFEVGPLGASIRGLYSRACLLAHDCTPNTTHSDDDRRRLTIRAARNIRKGDVITLSYAYTLQSTQKRRKHLMETKFFACTCERCSDPQELGTFAGAMLCPQCGNTFSLLKTALGKPDQVQIREINQVINNDNKKNETLKDIGIMLPLAPLDVNSQWKCNKCKTFTMTATLVDNIVSRINDEYDSIDVNDIEGYEDFLEKYKTILHPNHYLFLSTKLSLSQLYGKVDTHLIHKMSPEQLQLKRDICRDILKVFDILEPGYSRLRGTTLYELHAPIMVLTTRDYEKKAITKNELRTRLIEVAKCLHESSIILGMDPKDSSEGIMATAAKEALKQIKDWEKILGKII